MSGEKPFKLRVSVQSKAENRAALRGVLCEVVLPGRPTGPVELRLSSPQFRRHGFPSEFSVRGQIRQDGKIRRTVESTRVYSNKAGTTFWSQSIQEDRVVGEPMDLTITDRPGSTRRRLGRKQPAHVTFWLTPNIHLQPQKTLMRWHTGRVTVQVHRRHRVTVGGVRLTFDDYFGHADSERGGWDTFQEPVAAGSIRRLDDVPRVLAGLEDVLLLAGLAARQPTVCVGWQAGDSSVAVKHYRREISIPTERTHHTSNNALIRPKDFDRFLLQAYRVFRLAPEQELLREAIQGVVRDDSPLVLPTSFLRLFAAAETLVLRYRRMHDMEHVFPAGRFGRVAKAVKQTICTDVTYADKIKLLIEKVPELNRISFKAAAQALCVTHNVQLADLWPLTPDGGKASLSSIRNRVSHGETLIRDEIRPLGIACMHLRWTMERLVLSILKWPTDRTGVHIGIADTIPSGDVASARALLAQQWSQAGR